jgi:hypothetical protein
MATSRTQPTVGLSDPTVLRSIESQLAQSAIISNGKSTVSDGEVIFVGTTASVNANNVTLTTSANNQPADIVTVYSSQGTTYVSAIDQTVNQTVVNQTGVYAIFAGNGVSVVSSSAGGTGTVTIGTTAGNIAVINLDGNVSNVLRGNGSWGADANSAYGNSNVVSLLNAFGSNTITTTGNVSVGNIIGNGQALTGIAGANVSGFVANANVANTAFSVAAANVSGLGNIATINLDGNISNVLRGDGTFGADANSSYGDSNVTSLLGAFGSNTISTTGIITADGANLSNVPYTNLTGAPSLGNISSINLDGNVSNLLTGNGTYVAIPTVPTVGNIATINLDGSTSNVLYGNGVFAAIAAPTVTQDITSNGAMSIMTYDGNIKYVNNATVEPSTGNIAGGNISASGNISATNLSGNGGNITYQQTNTFYVDPGRTQNYTPSGSQIQPFFTVSAAISAAVTAGYNDSNPAFVVLMGNITENITLRPGVWLTSLGTGTHGSVVITGTVSVAPSTGTLASNHFALSNLRILAPNGAHGISVTGTAPLRLFLRDVWIDANTTFNCIFMNNSQTGSVTHLNTAHMTHSGSGDNHCIDVTAGTVTMTDIETSGNIQVGIVRAGATLTMDGSEIDANNTSVIEVDGGTLAISNSLITNTQANSNGINLLSNGSVATIVNAFFSIPAGTGNAVKGVATTYLFYSQVGFAPGSNTSKTASPTLVATQLASTFT